MILKSRFRFQAEAEPISDFEYLRTGRLSDGFWRLSNHSELKGLGSFSKKLILKFIAIIKYSYCYIYYFHNNYQSIIYFTI